MTNACPKCGAMLLPNARFCGSCGLPMPSAGNAAQQPNQPNVPFSANQPPQNYQAAQNQEQESGYRFQQADTARANYGNQPGAFHFDADGRGQGRGYTWEIKHQGAFALAVINLQPEQQIAAEAGAMVSM